MDGIRTVGMMLCACSLLSMLFSYLLPRTGLSAAVKGCAGVFFTAAILYALLSCNLDVSLDLRSLTEQRQQDITITAREKTLQLTENAVSDQLFQELRKGGFTVKKTEAELHMNKDGSIEISRITVTASSEQSGAISEFIAAEYGVVPVIQPAEDPVL